MTVHTIATTTHGRYLVEAAAGDAAGMLVGFHGQAETAAIELDHLRAIRGEPPTPFRYRNYGNVAVIGRGSAVVDIGPVKASGFLAWVF